MIRYSAYAFKRGDVKKLSVQSLKYYLKMILKLVFALEHGKEKFRSLYCLQVNVIWLCIAWKITEKVDKEIEKVLVQILSGIIVVPNL